MDPGLGFGKTGSTSACSSSAHARTADAWQAGAERSFRKSFVGGFPWAEIPRPMNACPALFHYRWNIFGPGRLFRVHDVAAHAEIFAISARLGLANPSTNPASKEKKTVPELSGTRGG